MHWGSAVPQRRTWRIGRKRKIGGICQLQSGTGTCCPLSSRQKYSAYHAELKVAFPEDDFPLNANILMATVIKLSLEVNSANLADCYSISLATADCLRNFANDLAKAYLPSLNERSENLRGLMTGVRKTIANEEELVNK